jgi:hypothetical protein
VKILLDNCVDWRVGRLLPTHDVKHAKDLGWASLENGHLLTAAAQPGFEMMITVDKRIKHEHNLRQLPLTVMELDLLDSRLPSVTAIADQINSVIYRAKDWLFISVRGDGGSTITGLRRRQGDIE